MAPNQIETEHIKNLLKYIQEFMKRWSLLHLQSDAESSIHVKTSSAHQGRSFFAQVI